MINTLASIIWGVTSTGAWVATLAAITVCLLIATLFYVRPFRGLPRFWWIALLTLRSAALLCICLSILQPTGISQLNPAGQGIAILIDRSASMSAIDTGDNIRDQLATAAGLNLFSPTGLAEKWAAGPNSAALWQNPAVRQACRKLLSMNRLARARAAVDEFVADLPSSVPIYAAFFDSKLVPIPLRTNGSPAWHTDSTGDGEQSDISGAINQLLHRTDPQRLSAILLFTDGHQVGGSLNPMPRDSAPPIFPVLCADTPRDLVLSALNASTRAYLDEPLTISAQIRSTHLADMFCELDLHADNLSATQTLQLSPAGEASTRIAIPMLRAGEQSIALRLTPIPGEASEINNQLAVRVNVLPRRMRLALLGSFPNRDFQFLSEQLHQSPWIDSTITMGAVPLSAQQLRQEDIVILDDLAASELDPAQWAALRDGVKQDGMGLILIAGANHLPQEYLSSPILSEFLPFSVGPDQSVWRTWAGADPYFRFMPAEANLSVLNIDNADSNILEQWQRLPAMYHYLQMPSLRPEAVTLLTERESGSPVLTQMSLGKGRVLFLGFNETWRWRSLGVAMQQRFWMRLIRHAATLTDQLQSQPQPAEWADLTPQTALLSRLAATKIFSLSELPRLWPEIQNYEHDHRRASEYPLWHSPCLFALIIGCFGAEWALRKRFGLA